MASVQDALDEERFRAIRHDTLLACNLWLAANLACERGDAPALRHTAEQIATLTRSTLALVKRLGSPDADDAWAKTAQEFRAEREQAEREGREFRG